MIGITTNKELTKPAGILFGLPAGDFMEFRISER